MDDKTNEFMESLLKAHPKEEIVAALNILAGLSKEELQGDAKIAQEMEESSSTI
ncbi:hypothetical protein [Psychrobacillus sp.]|uniref:hypothetical protein n=1 Tax=Psychrobacillus sp. TaxID=1871623 RepID=UPI0028BF5A20|nr:hypothetical protein [Psychrobacillus sp.]